MSTIYLVALVGVGLASVAAAIDAFIAPWRLPVWGSKRPSAAPRGSA